MGKGVPWLTTSAMALFVIASFSAADAPRHARLSDASLDSIRGLTLFAKTYSASESCEIATEDGGGPVSSRLGGCVLATDFTACVQCTAGSAVTPVPSSTSDTGIAKKSTTIACANATAKGGYCYQGECMLDNWPETCSGKPPAYQSQ